MCKTIKNYSDLKDGKKYWYISVEYNCHWGIHVHNFVFKKKKMWRKVWGSIIFDNQKEAEAFMASLQEYLEPYIIDENK